MKVLKLSKPVVEKFLRYYIEEDSFYGDATPVPETFVKAEIVAKESFVLSGVEIACLCFEICGSEAKPLSRDGAEVRRGDTVVEVEGMSGDVLLAERTALNILQRMSGIATATKKLVELVKPYGVRVAATRKTTPGFRLFEKLAVIHGGGDTHRMSLSDCVLVKDNHIAVAGGVRKALELAKNTSFTKKVEVEVSNLKDALEAVKCGADIIMLDNMSVEDVRKAVREIRKISENVVIEVSGGITPDNAEGYARTGVDVISSGYITHSARSVDVSMRIKSA